MNLWWSHLWLKNTGARPGSTKPGCQTCTKNVGAVPRLNPPSPNDILQLKNCILYGRKGYQHFVGDLYLIHQYKINIRIQIEWVDARPGNSHTFETVSKISPISFWSISSKYLTISILGFFSPFSILLYELCFWMFGSNLHVLFLSQNGILNIEGSNFT